MVLAIVGTCPTKHGLMGDACVVNCDWCAEPRTCAFLKDGYLWCILKLAWLGKGKQDYVFVGVLQGVELKAEFCHYCKPV